MSDEESTVGGATREELRGRIRRLEGAVAVLVLALLGLAGWTTLRSPVHHDVVRAERLEIVEPDGQPAFVLANSERPARGTFDGEVLMDGREEQRAVPNFIFFDGHGDEVGGMLFHNERTRDGFHASRHLSLDGYKQDQTVKLFHEQTPEGANSGLIVSDRPEDLSLREAFEEELGLEVPFTPGQADSALKASLPRGGRAERLRELFGVTRVYLGSTGDRNASLVLHDAAGRPRIVLAAPEDGDPYVHVLDEEGQPVAGLP